MFKKVFILFSLLICGVFLTFSFSKLSIAQSPSPPTNVIIWTVGRNVYVSWNAVPGVDSYKIYKNGVISGDVLRATVGGGIVQYTDTNGFGCPSPISYAVSSMAGSSESAKTYSSSVQRGCACFDADFNGNNILDPTIFNSCLPEPSFNCSRAFSQPYVDFYYFCQDINASLQQGERFYYTCDINKDGFVDIADFSIYRTEWNEGCVCPVPTATVTPTLTPTPTPTPTPTLTPTPTSTPTPYPCSTIYGYIKTPGGAGIGGATINLTKSGNLNCTGGVCASVISRAIDGYWRANCSGAVTCLRVIETANPSGYQDSSKLPTGPVGSEVWSVNGIVLKNPSVSSCGPFTFYDVLVPTPTPTPLPTATPTPTPTCSPTDPSRPILKSPVNSSILAMTEVTMEWFAVPSWGEDCLPGSNNRYKVYLSSSLSDTTDGDLSNEGGNLKCNVDESTLQCLQTNLTNGTVYYWQVEANNGSRHKLSNIWNFLIDLTAGSWWQTKDGDVHSEGNLTSLIPSRASPKYLSLIGTGGVPGVVSYTGTLDLGQGYVSSTNWQAKTNYPRANTSGRINFTYLKNRLNLDVTKNILAGNPKSLPAESGTYYSAENSELNGGTINNGKKIIIFVDGNVTVKGNVLVSEGSFFALITKGNLIFDGPVTKAQGFYLTDQTLTINDDGTDDNQFEGEGSFVGWEGVSLNRDIGAKGGTTPAELFTSRPDLYVNAPKEFSFKPFFFWEVAP